MVIQIAPCGSFISGGALSLSFSLVVNNNTHAQPLLDRASDVGQKNVQLAPASVRSRLPKFKMSPAPRLVNGTTINNETTIV